MHAIGVGHELSRLAKSALRWLQTTCSWMTPTTKEHRSGVCKLDKKTQNILGFYFDFFFLQYRGHSKKKMLCVQDVADSVHVSNIQKVAYSHRYKH